MAPLPERPGDDSYVVWRLIENFGAQGGEGEFWLPPLPPHEVVEAKVFFYAESLTASPYATRAPVVRSVVSGANISPDADSDDMVVVTALAAAAQLDNPTGSPGNGQRLVVRLLDDGTGRALTYDTQYRALGTALPATTVASKTLYLTFVFNSTGTTWDLIHAAQEL